MAKNSMTAKVLTAIFLFSRNQLLRIRRSLAEGSEGEEGLLKFRRSRLYIFGSRLNRRLFCILNRIWELMTEIGVKERWEGLLCFALILLAYLPEDGGLRLILLSAFVVGDRQSGSFPLFVWIWLGWGLFGALTGSEPSSVSSFLREALVVLAGLSAGLYRAGQRKSWKVWTVSGLPMVFLGLVQAAASPPYPMAWVSQEELGRIPFRITGVCGNPNPFALYLAFLLTVLLSGGEDRITGKWERNGLRLMAVLYFMALLFTFSRTGWVAAGAGVFFLWFRDKKRYLLRAAVGAILLFALWQPLALRISPQTITGGEDTVSYRLHIWRDGWRLVKEAPVRGIGSGGVLRRFPLVSNLVADHLHNLYLQTLVEKGVVGLTLLFILIYSVAYSPATGSPESRGVKAALLGQFTAGLMESVWSSPLLLLLFWFGYGYLQNKSGVDE